MRDEGTDESQTDPEPDTGADPETQADPDPTDDTEGMRPAGERGIEPAEGSGGSASSVDSVAEDVGEEPDDDNEKPEEY